MLSNRESDGLTNAEDVLQQKKILVHLADAPPEKMIRLDGDEPRTLCSGKAVKEFEGKTTGKSDADKVWANAGGLNKAIEFMQSRCWKGNGMPSQFWARFLEASNPYCNRFCQRYVNGSIMRSGSGSQQWHAKSNVEVVPSGVFRYVKKDKRLERIW